MQTGHAKRCRLTATSDCSIESVSYLTTEKILPGVNKLLVTYILSPHTNAISKITVAVNEVPCIPLTELQKKKVPHDTKKHWNALKNFTRALISEKKTENFCTLVSKVLFSTTGDSEDRRIYMVTASALTEKITVASLREFDLAPLTPPLQSKGRHPLRTRKRNRRNCNVFF